MDALGAAVMSFVVCTAIYKLSDSLSPAHHPACYAAEKPERKVLWNTTMVAIYPGFVVPWSALHGALRFYTDNGLSLIGPSNDSLRLSLGLSLGYMAFDTVMMLLFPNALRKAMKASLYNQMMYHHILSILIWPYAFYCDRAILLIAYFLFTESSNIFLNIRWLMAEKSAPANSLMVVNVLLFIGYTVVRILPIPIVLWVLYTSDWSKFSPLQLFFSVFCLIPLALNLFWYSLLLRGAYALLTGGGEKEAP